MILALCLGLTVAGGSEMPGLQLPNPGIFGKATSEPVKPLLDKQAGQTEPFVVWTDIRCGRYFAMSAFYRKPVTLAAARAAVNSIYQAFEMPMSSETLGLWRVVPEKFAIQVADADDEGEPEVIRVTYIHFLPPSEPFKIMCRVCGGMSKSDVDRKSAPDECIAFD